MTRILGIDFGLRRIGMAISDERHMMAFPYGVLDVKGMTPDDIRAKIKEVCQKEEIGTIVVGVPRGLRQMQDTDMTEQAVAFADSLKELEIPIKLEEEFLSSVQAGRGPTPKAKIDASAAAIVLQTYLDRQSAV